jgi:hypothetical protein
MLFTQGQQTTNNKQQTNKYNSIMTNPPRMITRSQVKQYNLIYTRHGELSKLIDKLYTETDVNIKISYMRKMFEIMNNNVHLFVEYDNGDSQRIRLFDTAYIKSLELIPDLKARLNRSENECHEAIKEIEKYQVNYKKYIINLN